MLKATEGDFIWLASVTKTLQSKLVAVPGTVPLMAPVSGLKRFISQAGTVEQSPDDVFVRMTYPTGRTPFTLRGEVEAVAMFRVKGPLPVLGFTKTKLRLPLIVAVTGALALLGTLGAGTTVIVSDADFVVLDTEVAVTVTDRLAVKAPLGGV